MKLFLILNYLILTSGSTVISRLQAEKTYENYLVNLGSSARALGTNPDHTINKIIETKSKTETESESKSERKTRIPLDRTERADLEVQFVAPLQNITLKPGSSVLINCDTVGAVGVELRYSPVYGYEGLQHVATIYHSATNTSLLIVQVLPEHQGWIECIAESAAGHMISTRAHISVRDLCAGHTCPAHQICQPDPYTDSYSCTCNFPCSDDDVTTGPVCGSDCRTYSSTCEMRRNVCERGQRGVGVARYGACPSEIISPEFVLEQGDKRVGEGDSVILRVHAVGSPDPIYRWYLNGERYKNETGDTVQGRMSGLLAGHWRVDATNCLINTVSTSFYLEIQHETLRQRDEVSRASVIGMSHVNSFTGTRKSYIITGTRLLLETNNVLLYGTFQPCYSTNKQTDKQTNKQTMEQTNTCLRSVTFHTPSTSVQLLTSNKISHDGETVVVKDHVTQLGHVTVTRGVTGYTVTAVNVTATWDGEVGWVVMVTCGSVTDTGLLGRPDCQLASTGEKEEVRGENDEDWLIEDYSGKKQSLQLISTTDKTCDRAEEHKRACQSVFQSPLFSNCLNKVSLDTETLLQMCLHDSCISDETLCSETTCSDISCGGKCQKPSVLGSPVCQLVWQIAEICRQLGMFLPASWREDFGCEDKTLAESRCYVSVTV
ncbi:hypothetical protein ACHWQZ_G001813 [Mnemiopsis leidyi]